MWSKSIKPTKTKVKVNYQWEVTRPCTMHNYEHEESVGRIDRPIMKFAYIACRWKDVIDSRKRLPKLPGHPCDQSIISKKLNEEVLGGQGIDSNGCRRAFFYLCTVSGNPQGVCAGTLFLGVCIWNLSRAIGTLRCYGYCMDTATNKCTNWPNKISDKVRLLSFDG